MDSQGRDSDKNDDTTLRIPQRADPRVLTELSQAVTALAKALDVRPDRLEFTLQPGDSKGEIRLVLLNVSEQVAAKAERLFGIKIHNGKDTIDLGGADAKLEEIGVVTGETQPELKVWTGKESSRRTKKASREGHD